MCPPGPGRAIIRTQMSLVGVLGWLTIIGGGASATCAGPPTNQKTQIVLHDEEHDPEGWTIANAFMGEATPKNTAMAMDILEEKLRNWESHPTGVVTSILDTVGRQRVESGRQYLYRFLRIDLTLSGAEFVASSAARAVGRLGGEGALEELTTASSRVSGYAVSSVAVALGVLSDPRAIGALEKIAASDDSRVRATALGALSKYCNSSTRPIALANLSNEDVRLRNSATWWFAACGTTDDAPYLDQQLQDMDELIRANALRGLIRLQSHIACGKLNELIEDENITISIEAKKYAETCDRNIIDR